MEDIQRKRDRLYMELNHVVYILQCKDDTLYTGYTNDLRKRIAMHEQGKGAKYTRGRGPFILKSTEYFATKQEAMRREYEVKRWAKDKKLAYIKEQNERKDD